jgi:hypothetical protein
MAEENIQTSTAAEEGDNTETLQKEGVAEK